MKFQTDTQKIRHLKLLLWLVFSVNFLWIFLLIILLLNFGQHAVIGIIFTTILILSSVILIWYSLFLAKALELLSTQEIYQNAKELLFYHVQKDGNEDGFGAVHVYSRAKEVKKLVLFKHFICIKGQFQTQYVGFPVLECQNPDEEGSKLSFSEQTDLVFFEDSHLKSFTQLIPRVFAKDEEKKLLNALKNL